MTYVGFRLGVDLASPNLADPDLAPPALLTLEKGTLSRSSEAYALGSDGLLDQYAANELRTEYRDGLGLYLLEGEQTNRVARSEEFDHADWAHTATVTANTDVAPDGEVDADQVEDNNTTGNPRLVQNVSTTASADSWWTFPIWVEKDTDQTRFPDFQLRQAAGDGVRAAYSFNTETGDTFERLAENKSQSIDVREAVPGWWHVSITVQWSASDTMEVWIFPALSSDSSGIGNPDDSATGSIVVWGAQLEESSFPTSYIQTTTGSAIRQSDSLTFASGDIPSRVLSGKFTQQIRPYAGSADLSSGDEQWLLSVGGSSDGIRIRHDGSDVLLEYLRGGVVITASAALTYSRHQLMGYTLDHSTGDLTVSGATSGDGTTTGTSGSWTAATLRVGGVQAGANEAFMGLGNLEKA